MLGQWCVIKPHKVSYLVCLGGGVWGRSVERVYLLLSHYWRETPPQGGGARERRDGGRRREERDRGRGERGGKGKRSDGRGEAGKRQQVRM